MKIQLKTTVLLLCIESYNCIIYTLYRRFYMPSKGLQLPFSFVRMKREREKKDIRRSNVDLYVCLLKWKGCVLDSVLLVDDEHVGTKTFAKLLINDFSYSSSFFLSRTTKLFSWLI